MSRADTIKQERRRRQSDELGGRRRKLSHGPVDRENFAYRWVNDEGSRLHDLTKNDDWEVVSDRSGTLKADGTGTGAEVSAYVGMGEQGRPVRAVLLRKPKSWHNDDLMAEQRRIDETESAMRLGAAPGVDGDGLRRPDSGEAISISHNSRA